MFRWSSVLRGGLAATLACTLAGSAPVSAGPLGQLPKLDKTLTELASKGSSKGLVQVIVLLKPGWSADLLVPKLGGILGRSLNSINGKVVQLPQGQLKKLAEYPGVDRIVYDRPTAGEMNRVAVTVGARAVASTYGYRGAGIGVAVIDSGVTSWHRDLTYTGSSSLVQTRNGQRVAAFVDFVNGRTSPYDDNGHGTHVAGIIAGNGYDTDGARAGIAPDAHLVSLKVLNENGNGVISDVIAALDWAVANKSAYKLRVINLSVGAAITESYRTDPLTLAAKRAVDAGLVVITAAGNLGRNSLGLAQYGGICAPGNAPWVITVGASNHEGTVNRSDDQMAPFSSRGPSAVDFEAKPDLVAPGVGTVSLSDPTSLMYLTKSTMLLGGTQLESYLPYLSLSGTSMAAPVVAGSVALMLEANPSLTPNLVKGILEYTAQIYPGYDALTEGAGFLNTKGAVDLARYFATAQPGQPYPHPKEWGSTINWGNHRITQGVIKPNGSAWKTDVVWGAPTNPSGMNIVWGTLCKNNCNSESWSTMDSDDNVVWGTASASEDNIVWGTFAALDEDNIVWGTLAADEDNIVWGTDCGGANCSGVIWGSASAEDNIVWGTASAEDNIVWGTASGEDNIVWGTAASEDNITWGTADAGDDPLFDDPVTPPANYDSVFENLFDPILLVSDSSSSTTPTTAIVSGEIGGVL